MQASISQAPPSMNNCNELLYPAPFDDLPYHRDPEYNSNSRKCSNGTNSTQAFPQAQSHTPWLDANNSTSRTQDGAVGLAAPRAAAVAISFFLYVLL